MIFYFCFKEVHLQKLHTTQQFLKELWITKPKNLEPVTLWVFYMDENYFRSLGMWISLEYVGISIIWESWANTSTETSLMHWKIAAFIGKFYN